MTDVVTSVHRCCCSWLKMTDVITSVHRCCWRWFKMTDDILRWYCQHLKLADDIGLKGKNTDVITSVHRCCWSWFKMTDDFLKWYCWHMKLADDIGQSCTDDLGLLYRWCWTDVVIFLPQKNSSRFFCVKVTNVWVLILNLACNYLSKTCLFLYIWFI